MAGHRRPSSKAVYRSKDDGGGGVVILSSSDDEEANRDLTLEIIERSRQRKGKRKRPSDESSAASAQCPVIDLSSDEAAAEGGVVLQPPSEAETAKRKRKKKKKSDEEAETEAETAKRKRKKKNKKKSDEETEEAPEEEPLKEEEPIEMTDSVITEVNEASDNVVMITDSVITEVNEASDNAVMRKLLRGPRYFDPGDRYQDTCYNCGEEGHRAASCGMEKRKKPCFVCGMFGHNARQCTQGQDCYICKRRGHIAKNCPHKDKQIAQDPKICLRCGDTGHEMSWCKNNYVPDDMKEIQCYMCKKYGHLCCVDLTFPGPEEVSCYKCARSGHTGLGCAKQSGENTVSSPSLCYKCGEEGHFARGCNRITKPNRWEGETSTPRRTPKKSREHLGSRSMPHDIGKPHKWKNLQHEDRRNTTTSKSKARGGWIVDDPDDMHNINHRSQGWKSPKTPVRKSPKVHSVNSARTFSSSQSSWKKHRSFTGTPNGHANMSGYHDGGHVSMGAYQHSMYASTDAYQYGYSASRSDQSQGHRRWRT